jgi:hypothetical protein
MGEYGSYCHFEPVQTPSQTSSLEGITGKELVIERFDPLTQYNIRKHNTEIYYHGT